MRQFDYYNRATDNRPKLCSPDRLRTLMASPVVAEQVERVRTAPDEEARAAAKRSLPAICWHGHCTSPRRNRQHITPSGLAMLDIDGVALAVPQPEASPHPLLKEGATTSLHPARHPRWIDEVMQRICPPSIGSATPPSGETEGASISSSIGSATPPSGETEGASICLIHITPSGNGLRVVGDMSRLGVRNIVEWQQTMIEKWGLQELELQGHFHLDTCVKDLSRLSFVVPAADVLYIDEELLWSDPAEGWTYVSDNDCAAPLGVSRSNPFSAQSILTSPDNAQASAQSFSSEPSAPDTAGQEVAPLGGDLEVASAFTYNGHTLTEIAEKWLVVFGRPVMGERHHTYFRMCTLFKNICERDAKVLFAQLPDFGKPADERWAMANDAIRRQPSRSLDPDFREFLIAYGFKEPEKTMSDIRAEQSTRVLTEKVSREEEERKAKEEERLSALMADIEAAAVAEGDWGKYPSVYNIFKRIFPVYMHKPAVLALDCIMGTYFSNVTACYLNGKMERPCFHNLIVGPASCGKGFIADMHADLTAKLLLNDTESLVRWQAYDKERARKRGAKELPEEPDVHYRLMETVFSNSSLLKRQAQGGGLHQLVFCTEMDSLYKNGGHKKFDDIYRCAYHMEEMSQFYLWSDGFNGRVKLLLNVLATGTPQQFANHYPTPENGLISRVNWYRIKELFSNEFIAKEMTAMERGYLDRVTDFALSLSYGEDEDGKRTFLPARDISEEMAFVLPACQDFLDKHLAIARETMDESRDQFRKRIALDMFRGAMVDWGCALGKLDKRRRQTIIDFRRAKAEEMLETKVAEFGEMVNRPAEVKKCRYPSLYDAVPDVFTVAELEQTARSNGFHSPIKAIVYAWQKGGIIRKTGNNKFEKK
jgi:hypothetical protein